MGGKRVAQRNLAHELGIKSEAPLENMWFQTRVHYLGLSGEGYLGGT